MKHIIQTIRHTARAAAVLLLALLAAQTAWAWDGEGTQNSPYQISSTQDLATLRDNVNGGQNYNNVYFKQTAPITLSGNWTPIGTTESTPFKGHYDGGNFTIRGLNVSGNYQYAGLFGYIASGDYVPEKGYFRQAELKNINIVECNINVGGVDGSKAGGIAGQASTVDMSGCRVSGSITGYSYAGGLIGHIDQTSGVKVTDCFVDVSVTSPSQYHPEVCLMAYVSGGSPTTSGNYCHDRIGNVSAGITATPLYMVTGAPSGVTVAETNATLTYNDKHYFAAGATATLTVDANQAFKTFSVSGATDYNVAADKKSATVTLATSDATVSATLQTVGGSCGTSATWALTQDGSGNYTRLTISGSGAMENYGHINDAIWHTTAPWGYDLTSVTIGNDITSIGNYAFIGCQQLSSLTIGSGVTTIGTNAIDHCDGLTEVTLPASVSSISAGGFKNCVGLTRVNIQRTDGLISIGTDCFNGCNNLQYIVAPTPALALQYKDAANWSAHAAKLRAKFGNQHFAVTTEGGTPAYQIATADDLRNLAAAVNATNGISTGKTFRQTADIDLASGGNFTPIGENGADESFAGTYDGGGHTISGLTVSKDHGRIGLFGVVKGATVRNVILLSPNVNATTTDNYDVHLGALIGTCNSGSSNLVENCHVVNPTVSSSSTSSSNDVGAIIGNIWDKNTTATNCYYYGGNATAACGFIEDGAPVTRVCAAHLVTPADGVTIQTPMAADLGFTCDADNNGTAENYWRTGAQLTLNYTGTVPDGYTIGYTATNGGTISGSTLTMPDADVTVTATVIVIPWDGDGSEGNPYLIQYPSQLDLLAHRVNGTHGETANDYYNTYFQLANDISYPHTSSWNDFTSTESNYEAIGGRYNGDDRYFCGHFDGNNKTISGIRIYKGGKSNADRYQGIFGQTASGADIHDLTLADARITGYYRTGGIVGYNKGGTVTRCHVADDVAVCAVQSYADYHGGIAGDNSGTIEQCTSAATLTIADATKSMYYGGIAGYNGGTLRDNLAIGATVPAAANNIYGTNNTYGAITGYNDGTLERNYYTACKVANTPNATGVGCGYIDDGNTTADVTADNGAVSIHTLTLADGITTSTPVTTTIGTTSYYAQGTTIALSYSGTTGDAPDGYQYGFTASAGTLSGSTLTMPAADVTVSFGLTVLPWSGDGSEDSPYIIYNKDQLDLLAYRVNGTHGETRQDDGYEGVYFKLNNDISYPHTSSWNDFTSTENNYEAIGGYYGGNRYFRGHFDGNNKTISGIRIYKDGRSKADRYQGIFGLTVSGADIHDLTLADARITGYDHTGGIVGYNEGGTVTRCHVAGDVAVCTVPSDTWYHGGIAGDNSGTIEQCTSAATLTTADNSKYYGGIAGSNLGTLRDNLAIGATVPATAANSYGAITGLNLGTLQRNYYAACKVNDTENATGVGCYNADVNNDNNPDGAVCINTLALTANQAPDGNYWTTYYNSALGFTIDADEHACAYTATYGAGQLTLHNLGKQIPKGTAVIIVADNGVVSMAAATDLDDFSGTNDLRGVDVDTPVANITSDLGEGTLYVLGMTTVGDEQHFGFHRYTGSEMAAHKAFVHVAGSPSQSAARSLTMVFDDATGIVSAEANSSLFTLHSSLSTWFTLDGRRLQAKPTAPGIYVNNGNKVIIK